MEARRQPRTGGELTAIRAPAVISPPSDELAVISPPINCLRSAAQ